MKLLLTLDFPPEFGGIQHYLYGIVKHTFTPRDILLIGTSSPSSTQPPKVSCRMQQVSTPLSQFNKKWSLFPLALSLLLYLRRSKIKPTVYAGNIYAAIPIYLISRLIPCDYRLYCYGTELLPCNKLLNPVSFLFRRILKSAERLYYISNATLVQLQKHTGNRPLKWLPPKIERPTTACLLKEPKPTYSFLSVGRLVPHKGHHLLLKAVASLPSTIRWTLTIIGTGPQAATLSALVKQLQIDARVTMLANVPPSELPEYYHHADLFVFPSLDTPTAIEGFGIALLEAMAYGTPIIAFRSGGISEVVAHGSSALLVEPGSVPELSASIAALTHDHVLRNTLAHNARKRLEANFVW